MCYPHGGVVDDVTLYRFDHDHYLFCVNAANTDKDFAWMEEVLEEGGHPEVTLRNVSDDFAQLALQGPALGDHPGPSDRYRPRRIAYYHFYEGLVAEVPAIISRTGYTGEDGFELYFAPEAAETLWNALLEAGAPDGLGPCRPGRARHPAPGDEIRPLRPRTLLRKSPPWRPASAGSPSWTSPTSSAARPSSG